MEGDSGQIKIGTEGTQTKTFIAGIRGITTGVAGAVTVMIDSEGQLGTVSSSASTKRDIANIARASEKLLGLRPAQFRYKQHGPDGAIQYGLIAEEVAEVFPELVVYGSDGKPETLKYHLLAPLLLNELQAQNETLRRQSHVNAELRRRLDRLEGQR